MLILPRAGFQDYLNHFQRLNEGMSSGPKLETLVTACTAVRMYRGKVSGLSKNDQVISIGSAEEVSLSRKYIPI